ncbi:TMEM175 family protein [Geomesophilobacter sediminis]|uniref:DUF1211 domain-containing protein n=1 Tax=Geomesophilobacter sediminis TaxID=2798584 RepID=A0A8J7LUQ2_9BACT|nr:TMEM175 family protein [Geomesophilobacter sediminis]MBJ6724919.1 DUF1211 domain-containing protein [Geomesophilobacter sediminis]
MNKNRIEAFSDGVLAIIITIMVLEMKAPQGTTLEALRSQLPIFLSYVLSFAYLGIYWNNHHHMLHTSHFVTGGILWANLHLLFWLSLFPIGTEWMGRNHFAPIPTAAYGVILLMAAVAYWVLQATIIHSQGAASLLKKAIGNDWKGKGSPLLYLLGVAVSFRSVAMAQALYVLVALIWLIPDRRIERLLQHKE